MWQMSRRVALKTCSGLLAGPAVSLNSAWGQPNGGRAKRGGHDFGSIHEMMEKFITRHQIAGATLGVYHDGQQVIAQGYGLAEVEKNRPVKPETLFSLASVTKALTGVGVLKLVDEGKLDINANVMQVLKDLHPLQKQKLADPRFRKVTVHHLLFHGGGLPHDAKKVKGNDDDDDGDSDDEIELQYRELLGHQLQFDPGTQHAYSNAGFLVLRLVIEHVTGQKYEPFIQDNILRPMGIKQIRMESPGDYLADETHRYQAGGTKAAMRKTGNWLASGDEIAKFAAAVAGSGGKSFLSPGTTALMLEQPASLKNQRKGSHVGLGWDSVEKVGNGHRFSKNGGKPGVQAWLEHLEYGVDWAVMFNTSSPKEGSKPVPEVRKLLYAKFQEILGIKG